MAISKDNTRIQVTLPFKVKEELEKKADLSNRSVSNYILNLILEDLKKKIKAVRYKIQPLSFIA